ncbi:hypothetical protein N2152v2_001656 [Parachlorella kessleri]
MEPEVTPNGLSTLEGAAGGPSGLPSGATPQAPTNHAAGGPTSDDAAPAQPNGLLPATATVAAAAPAASAAEAAVAAPAAAAAGAATPPPGSPRAAPPAGGAALGTPASPAAADGGGGGATSVPGSTPGSAPGSASKPRAQKTPYQKEALEAAFKLNSFPTEEMRRVLGEKIGLSEQQVATWFNHRRRKERKETSEAALAPAAAGASAAAPAGEAAEGAAETGANGRAVAAAAEAPVAAPLGGNQVEEGAAADEDMGADDEAAAGGEPDPIDLQRQQEIQKDRWEGAAATQELLELAKASLEEPFREDGPPLAFEFDEIPLAAGASAKRGGAEGAGGKRRRTEDDPDFEFGAGAKRPKAPPKPKAAAGAAGTAAGGMDFSRLQAEEEARAALLAEKARVTQERLEMAIKRAQAQERLEMTIKRVRGPLPGSGGSGGRAAVGEVAAASEQERLQKESSLLELGAGAAAQGELAPEKQLDVSHSCTVTLAYPENPDVLALPLQEQERLHKERERADFRVAKEREREISRLEAERKKHLEKMLKDQKKEEERRLKETARLRLLQEKEQKKLIAQLEKEKKAEERKKALEEKKKEKEMLKMLQQQERNAMRLRARGAGEAGPKDDVDWEWEALVAEYRAKHGLPADDPLPSEGSPPPPGLPPLPPRPPFPPPAVRLLPVFPPAVGDREGGELLTAWSFVASFGELIGMNPCTVDELLTAVASGASSALLSTLCCGLLRLVQADSEEAHAAGALQHPADPGQAAAAQMLEEGWAWGFDVDAWRAHLNALTWPEVARQLAIAAGLGRKRPKPKKEEKPKLGQEGEDIVVDEQGGLKLRLPPRLAVGSVKAAAWQVLAEAGPEGMRVEEIARRIQKQGLRDLRTSKTPEASVAGALGRDLLFTRVAPATYALQAIISYQRKLSQQQGVEGAGAEPAEGAAAQEERQQEAAGGVKTEPQQQGDGEAEPAADAVNDTSTAGAAASAGDAEAAGGGVAGQQATQQQQPEQQQKLGSPRGVQPGANAGRIEVVKSEPGEGGSPGDHGEEHEEDESEDEEEEKHEEVEGAPWIRALEGSEFDQMPLDLRISMLASLCDLAMGGPTVRDMLERRLEEQQRIKKAMWDENKAEKRRKQIEAAAKAKAAAEEAQRQLEKYKAAAAGTPGAPAPDRPEGGAAAGTAGTPAPAGEAAATAGTAAVVAAGPAADEAAAGPAADTEMAEADGAAAAPASLAAATAAPTPTADPAAAAAAAAAANPAAAAVGSASGAGPEPQQAQQQPGGEAGASPAPPADPHAAAAAAIAAMEAKMVKAGETEEERAAARQRQAQRAEQVRRDMEANSVRLEPLGQDRRYNRYWRFVLVTAAGGSACGAGHAGGGEGEQAQQGQHAAAEDACAGRLFFESHEDGGLRMLATADDLEALINALERRGAREGGLYASLLRCREAIAKAMPAAPLALPAPPGPEEALAVLEERANALMACVPVGAIEVAGTADTGDLEEESAELLHLKAGLLMVLAALPGEALPPPFDPDAWREAVKGAATPLDLRRALGRLEEGLHNDYVSPAFHRRPLLVKGAWLPTGNEVASALPGSTAADLLLPDAADTAAAAVAAAAGAGGLLEGAGGASGASAAAEPLAWLPATAAAVGLRLLSLDASLFYSSGAGPTRERLEGYKYIQRPAPPSAPRSTMSGLPISAGGRARPTLFPPFPGRLLFGPRLEFSFPLTQFQKDWATGSSTILAAPKPKGVGKGRGQRRTGGRGSRGGGRGGGAAGRPSSRAASVAGAANKKGAPGKEDNSDGVGRRGRLANHLLPQVYEEHLKQLDLSGARRQHQDKMGAEGGSRVAVNWLDSERHYGTDFDDDEDEGMEFASAPPPVYGSMGPSGAPSEAAADDDRDEEISDADEEVSVGA